ncbi:protease s28 pro-x carboxypeptidase-related [Holotrichia oblita]|uniref:Protease s28 pro-x carboxypeptidase-related n=1 Tax=Holotrichia oblita TaxID=644536 RepID=A0ACB9SVF0_HOLOL|nr:protease s28 pro-x carboxypeptidase-related [Holotrichia oblita]
MGAGPKREQYQPVKLVERVKEQAHMRGGEYIEDKLGVIVAITLVIVLESDEVKDEITDEEYVCDGSRTHTKISLKTGQRSHIEKFRQGPPPLEGTLNRAAQPKIDWITQRIDHFDPTNLETWSMRYMYNDEFYVEGSPMFIFLGGEWEISAGYLMTGQMYDMAEEHDGYMFYTEHRYYGQSFPTKDICTYNLQFENADQALADIAYFIEYQKSKIAGMENSKVVVVGGSYSAMLATWMRVKYPHLVDAALSSSAPLRAVADFYEYYEVVAKSLEDVSEECVSTIAEAMDEIDTRFQTESGIADVSTLLGMENPVNASEPNRSYFFSTLASPFAQLVQYASGTDLEDACSTLLSYEGTAFKKFISYINMYYHPYTITDYDYYVSYLRNPRITSGIYRQWYYQTCTEYGFYQTASSTKQPFKNFGVDLFIKLCEDAFEIPQEVLNLGIERTNLLYGSVAPEVTRVVSTHGTVDPWHPLGVLNDVNPEAPVFVINGASHCADLSSLGSSDSAEMINAKTKVKEYIAEWIS